MAWGSKLKPKIFLISLSVINNRLFNQFLSRLCEIFPGKGRHTLHIKFGNNYSSIVSDKKCTYDVCNNNNNNNTTNK